MVGKAWLVPEREKTQVVVGDGSGGRKVISGGMWGRSQGPDQAGAMGSCKELDLMPSAVRNYIGKL